MIPLRPLRAHLTVATLLAASVALPTPAAQAAPVFTDTDFYASASASAVVVETCTLEQTRSTPVHQTPEENGRTLGASASTTGTLTRNGDPSDVLRFSARHEGTASLASSGDDPQRLALTVDGTLAVTATKAVSACTLALHGPFEVESTFTVSRPGFLTVSMAAGPHTQSQFYLTDSEGTSTFGSEGTGPRFADVSTVYLPPGRYEAYLFASPELRTSTAVAATQVGASVRADFAVAGSQTAGTSGRGSKYVDLPTSRSCTTHTLASTVTPRGRRARDVKQVKAFVNGALVAKARTPRKSQVVQAPVADDVAADLRVEVTLRPSRPGRPGKSYAVTASYAPCP